MPFGSELLSQPNTVSNAAWFKLNCTASGTALNASGTTNVQHLATQAFNFVATTTYRLYVEADADEVSWIAILAAQVSGANDCLTWFNLATGAFGTTAAGTGVTVVSRRAWEVSTGRWGVEIIFSGASTPGAGKAITVIYSNADNTPAFAATVGDGVSIHTISLTTATITSNALPYTSIGSLPDANEIEILGYGATYEAQRLSECPVTKTTTHYISKSASGNAFGGGGAGTQGNPWLVNTKASLKNFCNAKAACDTSFLLNRDSEWYGTGEVLNLSSMPYYDNISFGAWGSGTNPPLIAEAELLNGGSDWTLDSGNTWKRTDAVDVAWVFIKSGRDTSLLSMVSSTSDLATSISGCYGRWIQSAGVLYVNLGGDNPNSMAIEVVHDNQNHGIALAGTGCRVDRLDFVGHGMDQDDPHNQIYPVYANLNGNRSMVISNVRAWGVSTHGPSMHGGAGSGGFLCTIDCESHVACPSVQTPTMFNWYTALGAHEGYCRNLYSNCGEAPTGLTPTRKGALFFAHTNGTAGSLFIASDCSVGTGSFAPWLGGWENIPARTGFDARAFIIGCTDLYRVTHEHADIAWINNTLRWSPTGSTNPTVQQTGTNWRGLHLNTVFVVDRSNTTAVNCALLNKVSGTNDATFVGCALYLDGTSNTTTGFYTNYREIFDEVATGTWSGSIFADLTANVSSRVGWNNDATKLLGNAYSSNLASSTDAGAGYSNDATKRVVAAPVFGKAVYRLQSLDPANLISSLGFYSNGTARASDSRVIGPFEGEITNSGPIYSSVSSAALSPAFSPSNPPLCIIGR